VIEAQVHQPPKVDHGHPEREPELVAGRAAVMVADHIKSVERIEQNWLEVELPADRERQLPGHDQRAEDTIRPASREAGRDGRSSCGHFDYLVRRTGLSRISLHGLRHTWATLALRAGVHPKILQERLGHSTIAITLEHMLSRPCRQRPRRQWRG
jgi:integrase